METLKCGLDLFSRGQGRRPSPGRVILGKLSPFAGPQFPFPWQAGPLGGCPRPGQEVLRRGGRSLCPGRRQSRLSAYKSQSRPRPAPPGPRPAPPTPRPEPLPAKPPRGRSAGLERGCMPGGGRPRSTCWRRGGLGFPSRGRPPGAETQARRSGKRGVLAGRLSTPGQAGWLRAPRAPAWP